MRSVARAVIVTALTLLVATSCGGSSDKSAATETSASAGPFDRAFIDAMVPHHRSAIEMAKTAQSRGLKSPELERMAGEIIASQQREIDQMLDWREKWFGSRTLGPPSRSVLGIPESNQGMSAMTGMSHDSDQIAEAKDVDATFAALMIPHHKSAVAMAETALGLAEHEQIRKLAEDIIAAQNREIEVLKKHAGGMQH